MLGTEHQNISRSWLEEAPVTFPSFRHFLSLPHVFPSHNGGPVCPLDLSHDLDDSDYEEDEEAARLPVAQWFEVEGPHDKRLYSCPTGKQGSRHWEWIKLIPKWPMLPHGLTKSALSTKHARGAYCLRCNEELPVDPKNLRPLKSHFDGHVKCQSIKDGDLPPTFSTNGRAAPQMGGMGGAVRQSGGGFVMMPLSASPSTNSNQMQYAPSYGHPGFFQP